MVICENYRIMSTVIINGKQFDVPHGSNVSVSGNKVYVNGKLLEDCNKIKDKDIYITVNGDMKSLTVDNGDVHVAGNVDTVTCDTGDINIKGDVSGNVSTDTGDIRCGNVGGNVKTDTGDVSHTVSQVIQNIKNKIKF